MKNSENKSLLLNPTDTIFFRDGRPFNMGEDTYAQGIFPPPPSVLYGALRTAYMAANLSGEKLSVLITRTEQLSKSHSILGTATLDKRPTALSRRTLVCLCCYLLSSELDWGLDSKSKKADARQ